ncbi:MAG TPA: DUF2889 domain-containing protein [Trebonia sp.]|nr:DUF2889 domain-containing protein [Trebonia sp.]
MESIRYAVPGPTGPAAGTPARRPHSVRRTTTHDSLREHGTDGPVTAIALGRDLYTSRTGEASVLAAVRLEATSQFPGHILTSIGTDPVDDRVRQLTGKRASAGFRRAVEAALPGEREAGTLLYQVLDDLPTALLVSGYATLAATVTSGGPVPPPGRSPAMALQVVDMCSGWVDGGVMVSGLNEGRLPYFEGTVAPGGLEGAGDPLGWHAHGPLPAHAMRRRRRLDVWPGAGLAHVEAFFRDSHVAADRVERVVHEYTVRATVDMATRTFCQCQADFGSLPWPECPGALASAGRLAGVSVDGLRRRVREDFTGVGTCTHLNDTLRALEDVSALIDVLDGQSRG